MPHRQTDWCPYPSQQVYAVLADVEQYSTFVPGCAYTKVYQKTAQGFRADMGISRGRLGCFTSDVQLHYPYIYVTYVPPGPLQYLTQTWQVKEENFGTTIEFYLDMAVKSRILHHLFHRHFPLLAQNIARAFHKRIHKVCSN